MKPAVCFAILLLSLIVVATAAHAGPLSRPADPVVLKGDDLPMFKGKAPDSLVAFRYEGGWVQIPIQVDERDVRSYGVVYDFLDHWSLNDNGGRAEPLYPFLEEFYTDPGTYMGPDTDPMLDDNDEVVFMVKDTGNKAPAIADPQGVVPGSGFEVRVNDPLDGATGYVYLFQSAGGLDPSAGQSYVDYQFKLESGAYLETFRLVGINLELSTVSSQYYERTFTSRLLSEVLRITAPGASGVDILDRYKYRIRRPLCQVTEESIERHEGAFVANKSGPVRGIRSHMGFRSGSAIRHDYFFYEQREDIVLHWLAHANKEGFHVFADYDPAAIGMAYFNNNNTGGVAIDGRPDSVIPGVLRWELVSGSPGSLVIIQDLVTDFLLFESSYYLDDFYRQQCAGDAFAIGSSGQSIGGIPDTDPRTSSNPLAWVSSRYYGPPGWSVADADQFRAFSDNPLVATVQGPELHLAHFGNGGGLQSDVVVFDPSSTASASGEVNFFDDDGTPLDSSIFLPDGNSFTLAPLGSATLSTNGAGDLFTGSATISSDIPISAVIRFDIAGVGVAGVEASQVLTSAIAPVRRTGTLSSGVAVRNTGTSPIQVTLELKDENGDVVSSGTETRTLAGNAKIAEFIETLFPNAQTETFTGTICVTAQSGQIAVIALELDVVNNVFTTLPVTPLE